MNLTDRYSNRDKKSYRTRRLFRSFALSAALAMIWGCVPQSSSAQTSSTESTASEGKQEAGIRATLNQQVDDWNKGDMPAFMAGYENSPETIFMGKKIRKGYQAALDGYLQTFPDKEHMGKLSFSDLEVHALGADYGFATGSFQLERTTAGGGNTGGSFSLIFKKTAAGWKIILDHTTSNTTG